MLHLDIYRINRTHGRFTLLNNFNCFMCTNQKLIFNKYMRRPMYVKCGHCKSCLQEKANMRVKRIRATEKQGYVCLMVSLTYARNNAPYILRDDAYKFTKGQLLELPVYRDVAYRKVRKPMINDSYFQDYKITRGRHLLDVVRFDISKFNPDLSLQGTKDMKHEFGKIGVCRYEDYQEFIARFRQNLKRHYNNENKLFIYACSEYGCKSFRPHFHLLIFCKATGLEVIKSAIFESWPFSNLRRFPRAVEVAYRASSYVASYVNSGSKFPLFFKSYFKQKHSYSKGFGTNSREFSLASLLKMFDRGNFRYSVLKNISGANTLVNVPVPSYVISRYFPKFKGYSRISPTSLVENMQRFAEFKNPYEVEKNLSNLPFSAVDVHPFFKESSTFLYWSDDEVHKIGVCLNNAYLRFCEDYPDKSRIPSFYDYCVLHTKVWRTYNSTLLRLQMEDDSVPLVEHFDNLGDYLDYDKNSFAYHQGVKLLRFTGINPDLVCTFNPNEYSSVRQVTAEHTQWFENNIKHRNVRNSVYLSEDANCEL